MHRGQAQPPASPSRVGRCFSHTLHTRAVGALSSVQAEQAVRGSGWLAVPFEARRLLGAGSGPAGASGASLPARCVPSTGDGGRVVRPVRAHLRAVVVELLLRRLWVSAH